MSPLEEILAALLQPPLTVGRRTLLRVEDPLCRFTPFRDVPRPARAALLDEVLDDPRGDRAVGCLVGMAVGDGVGCPLEFQSAVDPPAPGHPSFDLATMQYHRPLDHFGLARGQWTDDTSMGLCIADSLLDLGRYDGSDLRVRFWNWWYRGYDNAFRLDPSRDVSVGLGGNISDSLHAMPPGETPPARYEAPTHDAGNGSIMRLAAVPIFFRRDLDEAVRLSAESSLTTHPGAIAREACAFLGYLLARAIGRDGAASPRAFLDVVRDEYLARLGAATEPGQREVGALLRSAEPDGSLERNWNWRADRLDLAGVLARRGETYHGYPVLAEYLGAYCIDGLAMALHAVYHAEDFGDAVARCVNFLGDADSTGAVAGQIAGAIFGYRRIDPRMVANLRRWDDDEIALRGAMLYALGGATSAP